MIETDVFAGRRAELIDGEILEMSPQNNRHIVAVSRTARLLLSAFDDSYWVMIQGTIRLPRGDMPDPDFAIRPGPMSVDNSVQPLPLLVIEVSDETLRYDRTAKASMYAANGIADYWVINLPQNVVEVYRTPVADAAAKFGYRYADVVEHGRDQKICPLAAPSILFDVDRMLP